jgi:hypothetical protein
MTNIIDFPTPEPLDTPITPEFLMEFCEEFEFNTVEHFMAVFNHCLEDIDDEEEDDDDNDDDLSRHWKTYLENIIYPKRVIEFLEENGIRCDADMEEFSQMINLLTAEPNVPLPVMN